MSNSRLAPDLEPILLALREKGLRTLEDYASVEEYREVYEQVCQATALKPDSEVLINTLTCQTTNGLIRLRHYSLKDLKTKKSQPCTIFIHGGGWVLGNLEAYDGVC